MFSSFLVCILLKIQRKKSGHTVCDYVDTRIRRDILNCHLGNIHFEFPRIESIDAFYSALMRTEMFLRPHSLFFAIVSSFLPRHRA